MADQRPPRFAAGEFETLMELWKYHRESFIRKLSGLSDEEAAKRFVGSETTLLWLANHMAASQLRWLVHVFAGEDAPALTEAVTVAEAIAACQSAWARIDAVIERHSLDDLCQRAVHGDPSPVNLRWVVAHLLEETARHAGHADIIRELIDGSTGR